MNRRFLPLAALSALVFAACTPPSAPVVGPIDVRPAAYDPAQDSLRFPEETHLRNVRQLTFGGNNAEAYWSFDDKQLIFQSDWGRINAQGCDQQFVMNADGSVLDPAPPAPDAEHAARDARYRLVSTGRGRTTCGYFLPTGELLYGSTHAGGTACPASPPTPGRYVWHIYETYDIYVANGDGSNPRPYISGPGYDAEATVSPNGRYVVYTSTRGGDLDLWRLDRTTGETIQLTNTPGYDGGAFFSHDGTKLVWRASRPVGAEQEAYERLLAQGMVEPSAMHLFVANADGSNPRQITNLPGASWAPYFTPDDRRILFSSNYESMQNGTGGRTFAIYMVNTDGSGLQKITHSNTFEAFPMFSNDGKKIVFASNRRVDRQPSRETNIFVADWVE